MFWSTVSLKPTIITGFQSTGLVGTLATQYLVKKLGAKQIGHMTSEDLPPIAILVNGEIKHPIRIFHSKKHNVIIFESELPIPPKLSQKISSEIVEWAKKNKAKQIICIEGMKSQDGDEKPDIYAVVSDEKHERLVKKHANLLSNGIIAGMAASILLESKGSRIPTMCYLVESNVALPDGKAAAAVIDKLNEVLNLNVDSRPLYREAERFEQEIKKLLEKAEKSVTSKYSPDATIYG